MLTQIRVFEYFPLNVFQEMNIILCHTMLCGETNFGRESNDDDRSVSKSPVWVRDFN